MPGVVPGPADTVPISPSPDDRVAACGGQSSDRQIARGGLSRPGRLSVSQVHDLNPFPRDCWCVSS